jgi:hypothetical protein
MSSTRDFLKEAIADAKIIRETAIAKAKMELEEQLSPYVKEVLSLKLEEMENSDLSEDEFLEENEVYEEEISLDEILNEIESLDENEDEDKDEDENENEEPLDLENMTDEDLKKFIEDVIKGMIEAGELEANENEEEENGEEVEMEDSELENLDEYGYNTDPMDDPFRDEDYDLDSYDEFGDSNWDDEEIPLDIEDDEFDSTIKRPMVNESEIKKLKKELHEAKQAITIMRKSLNEINLLNSKLLYVSKIFNNKNNLNENQKLKIINSFDKATNVKEAKLVYESLISTLNTPKNQVKNYIKEGMIGGSSKSTNITSHSKKPTPILESNEMVTRFQKLAGII